MPKLFPLPKYAVLALITIAANIAIIPSTLAAQPLLNSPKSADTMSESEAADPLLATVQALYDEMDKAANDRNRDMLLGFYSPEFTTGDGLDRETLSQSIDHLWQQYPQLTYKTEVVSATQDGSDIDTETLTRVTGKDVRDQRDITVDITVRSQQRWQGKTLVQQEILSEKTRVSLGENPPTVSVNLPDTVEIGQRYRYEAVVEEPLERDILMGNLLDQPITAAALIKPKTLQLEIPSVLELIGNREFSRPTPPAQANTQLVKLERLRAGGFFKSGLASSKPENRWLSAVLVRHDAGLTIVTQRLRVVEK